MASKVVAGKSEDSAGRASQPLSSPTSVLAEGIASTDRFYEQHAVEYFERTVSAEMGHLYSRFLPLLPPKARILDAGCGSGRDLRYFSERGYQASGVDASAALVELARSHSNAPCLVGRLEELEFDHSFEAVWACASLLHIPRSMIADVLFRLHRAIARNGVIFASVQEGTGERLTLDGRFFTFYQRKEFAHLVEAASFVLIDVWESEDVLQDSRQIRWINVLARRAETPGTIS